jgi:beta-1,4-mannosyltransferase
MVKPNVGVLVYGDIGRSPRMQNHALQLARNFQVYLIGYKENAPFTEVTDHPDIEIVDISNDFLKKLKTIRIFYLYALLRVIIQTLQLLFLLLFRLKSMEFILVQNPPSIPVLSTVWIASIIRRFKMIVDFHNYGYTILKMNVKNRFIIAVAEKYEKMFSRKSAYSFCVSDNMRQNLQKEWGITAIPLYDRPSNKHLKVNAEAMLKKVGV